MIFVDRTQCLLSNINRACALFVIIFTNDIILNNKKYVALFRLFAQLFSRTISEF